MLEIKDYLNLITAPHNKAVKYMSLIEVLLKHIKQSNNYLYDVWNAFSLDNAYGKQLDTIGEWVGLSREIAPPIEDLYFSWDVPEYEVGWNEGIWKDKFDKTEGISRLPDDLYRMLIKVKISANMWDGTYAGLIELWQEVFKEQNSKISIKDYGNMTADLIIYNLGDSTIIKQIINLGYLPIKSMGIKFTYIDGGIKNAFKRWKN